MQNETKPKIHHTADDHTSVLPLNFIDIIIHSSQKEEEMIVGIYCTFCVLTVLISKHVTRVSSVTQQERRSEAEVCSSSRTPGERASHLPQLCSMHNSHPTNGAFLKKVTLPFSLLVPRRYQPQCSNTVIRVPMPATGCVT